jgi:YbbR domain-containing protein
MKDFLRRYIFHNLGLKLISLGLAVGLWLAVARDPMAEVAVNVPLEFHEMPANLEISAESIPTAQIRLRGPERIVHQLRSSDVYAQIELGNLRPGERTFDLTDQQVHRPAGLEVVQVVPSQVHFAFDVRLIRRVPVQPRVVGSFASGYQIGQLLADPAFVTISGPKKRVEAVEAATTDPVDVSGTMTSATFVRHAYVSDALIQVSDPNPVRITVIMERTPASNGH